MFSFLALQGRFIKRVSGLLTSPNVTQAIVSRWQSYLQQIDGDLASKVRLLGSVVQA